MMPRTQMIRLSDRRKERLTGWLEDVLTDIENRIEARVPSWIRWREQYEAKTYPKDFPWKNASNVHTGITGIMVDAIHANMMNRLYGFSRLYDVLATKPEMAVGMDAQTGQPVTWTTLAKELQTYLAWETSEAGTIEMYETVKQGILECVKLGTVVWYLPWVTNSRPEDVYDEETESLVKGEMVTHYNGPAPQTIPLEDFLIMPFYCKIHGEQASPLIGHKELLRPGQILQAVADGHYFEDAKEVAKWGGVSQWDPSDRVKDDQARLEGEWGTIATEREDDPRIYKLHLEVDFDEDGLEERIYVEYHRETQTILASRPWPYPTRPYEASRYVEREYRFYGIGVPEILESPQRAINTSVNQAIDNATIANIRGFAARRNSIAARSLDTWYPGKKLLYDRPDDLKDFQLGEVYPSAFEIPRLLQGLMERRVGVGDPNLGMELPKSNVPAEGLLTLLQENAKRFDLYSRDIRRGLSEIGLQLMERLQQFQPGGRVYSVRGEKGELVGAVLSTPTEVNLREHLRVVTTSSASAANKETARQNSLSAFTLIIQYFKELGQLAVGIQSSMDNPAMQQLFLRMGNVGELLMMKILESMDLQDVAALMPQLEGLENGADGTGLAGGPGGSPGGRPPEAVGEGGVVGPQTGGPATP